MGEGAQRDSSRPINRTRKKGPKRDREAPRRHEALFGASSTVLEADSPARHVPEAAHPSWAWLPVLPAQPPSYSWWGRGRGSHGGREPLPGGQKRASKGLSSVA